MSKKDYEDQTAKDRPSSYAIGALGVSPEDEAGILHAQSETPREAVLDDQGVPKPCSVGLDSLINPLFGSGG